METFIAGVRAHPCLWNPLHSDYREMQVRDDAWQRVVQDCNNPTIPSVKVARATWRKLRDNHREALKRAKLGQNKLLPAQITTWKYAKAMQFLEPHMKYRITENIDSEVNEDKISNVPEQDVSTSDCTNQVRESPPQKRRCVEYPSETTTLQQEGDALESFFLCMLKSTREMPLWMQTQVKKKIFAVIIEAEEQLSNECKAPTPSHETVYSEYEIKRETFTDDSCDYT